MKRSLKILTAIAVVILLAGVGFLLFPPVSNFIGQKQADAVADTYDKAVESITESVSAEDGTVISSYEEAVEHGLVDDEGYPVAAVNDDGSCGERIVFALDLERLKQDSLAYNTMLLTGQGTADTIQYERPAFELYKYGLYDEVYCTISAPAIGLRLPVYLGASDEMMSYGAGHLYGTSLPVGNMDANVAVAGHTGYIGRIFFDHIRNLEIGDEVELTTWWDTFSYRVVKYTIVKENDSEYLMIQPGRQLLTLITCSYDGEGNMNRYLVVCEKVKPETVKAEKATE